MPDDRYIMIRDWAAFGQKITEWATGASPWPGTVAEFKVQVLNTVVELGPGFGGSEPVQFHQPPAMAQVLSFVLPNAAEVNAPLPAGSYEPPDFYSKMAFGNTLPSIAGNDRETFRLCRIADYSANRCM